MDRDMRKQRERRRRVAELYQKIHEAIPVNYFYDEILEALAMVLREFAILQGYSDVVEGEVEETNTEEGNW